MCDYAFYTVNKNYLENIYVIDIMTSQDLLTLQYKQLLQQNNSSNKYLQNSSANQSNLIYTDDSISNFLEHDINKSKKESWSRLDKTTKLNKLNEYMKKEVSLGNMSQKDADSLYNYLKSSIDRKRVQNTKIIEYDIQTKTVTSIKQSNDAGKKSNKLMTKKKNPNISSNATNHSRTIKINPDLPEISLTKHKKLDIIETHDICNNNVEFQPTFTFS